MGIFDDFLDNAADALGRTIANNEILYKGLTNAVDFIDAAQTSMNGGKVQHLQINGKDVSSKGSHIGESFGKTVKNVVEFFTPEEWKTIGKLAYKIASFNIPVLAVIDWNKIANAAENINDKGVSDYLINEVNWKEIGKDLVLAKAESTGMPVEVIDDMLGYVDRFLENKGEKIDTNSELITNETTSLPIATNESASYTNQILNDINIDNQSIYVYGYNPESSKKSADILISTINSEQLQSVAENMFLNGKLDDAFELFLHLGDNGYPRAMYFLGEYFHHNYGHIKKDINTSFQWRRKGSELGDPLAALNTAWEFPVTSKEREEILNTYIPRVIEMAEQGDPFAQNEAADLFLSGQGCMQDNNKGIELLSKSSDKGYWRSTTKLGNIYKEGVIVTPDTSKAVEYYKKAAELGDTIAQNSLANAYYGGVGTNKDLDLAKHWYQVAAENGNDSAISSIAYMYYNGDGVSRDTSKAFYWAKKGAELYDNVVAMGLLGVMYCNGEGVSKDNHQAFYWLKKSAESGDTYAQSNLAVLYENGMGTSKDLNLAKHWYQVAANNGDGSAKNALSRLM
ncbi:tetratricopeptide repeat protein [Oribacterium sp. P6A1]|uniref:tetratricopeptide repeat protein n=1 Tax=Oribacterium sp. P6A1 TaxID=1410612 RepID=UPI00068BC93F|nr:SEL1-like repeat protein [Oribacterium sp. P6A1]